MISVAAEQTGKGSIADVLSALLASEGSADHPFLSLCAEGGATGARALTDSVHHLCALYGRHPGVFDLSADRLIDNRELQMWIAGCEEAFVRERSYLTRVVVAAGPLPSTPGQAACESAVINQRHAIEMLSKSDRMGCALGTAFALALDWSMIRSIIDVAAARFDVEPIALALPTHAETYAVAEIVGRTGPGVERAITFGAQQLLVQQRGLWHLLEARQVARQAR